MLYVLGGVASNTMSVIKDILMCAWLGRRLIWQSKA